METNETRTSTTQSRESSNTSGGTDRRPASSSGGGGPRQDRGGRRKRPYFVKKKCRFCENKDILIDYKQVSALERFVTNRGKISPRRFTGTCARHQRKVAAEIKKARFLALLPYTDHKKK